MEEQTVTFPGADELIGVSWDGRFLLYHRALIGYKEWHRLPNLRERREQTLALVVAFGGDYKIMLVIP